MGMNDAVMAVTVGESALRYQMRVFEIDKSGRMGENLRGVVNAFAVG